MPLGPQYGGDLLAGLVCEHVVTRTVRDTAAILDAVADPRPGDPLLGPAAPRRVLRRRRLATPPPATAGGRRPTAVAHRQRDVHADCAHRSGSAPPPSANHWAAKVMPAALTIDGDAFTAHFINVWAAGNAWTMDDWEERVGRTATEDDVEPLTWALVELGRSVHAPAHLKSMQELQKLSPPGGAGLPEDFDVLLTPTLGRAAGPPRHLRLYAGEPLTEGSSGPPPYVPFTPPFNVTGQARHLRCPVHWNDAGLHHRLPSSSAAWVTRKRCSPLAGRSRLAQPWAERRPPSRRHARAAASPVTITQRVPE